MIKFTDNGYQVHPPPDIGYEAEDNPNDNFKGRVPLFFSPQTRQIWLGGPNWFHTDAYHAHNVDRWDGPEDYKEGFIGSGRGDAQWGTGLNWYGSPPVEHNDVQNALIQSGHLQAGGAPVVKAEDLDADDLWEDDEDDLWED